MSIVRRIEIDNGSLARGANVAKVFRCAEDPLVRRLPLIEAPRALAGVFGNATADFLESELDLNELMTPNPPSTFFVLVSGASMESARIFDKDIVPVDRSMRPKRGSIVVAAADGDLYLKCLERIDGRLALVSKNDIEPELYPPLFCDRFQDLTIWGVVTGVVRKF